MCRSECVPHVFHAALICSHSLHKCTSTKTLDAIFPHQPVFDKRPVHHTAVFSCLLTHIFKTLPYSFISVLHTQIHITDTSQKQSPLPYYYRFLSCVHTTSQHKLKRVREPASAVFSSFSGDLGGFLLFVCIFQLVFWEILEFFVLFLSTYFLEILEVFFNLFFRRIFYFLNLFFRRILSFFYLFFRRF